MMLLGIAVGISAAWFWAGDQPRKAVAVLAPVATAVVAFAIWAMREGDPKTYLASLAPDEQQRVNQNWQNKTEAELAEKHKSDVAAISGKGFSEVRYLPARAADVPHNVLDCSLIAREIGWTPKTAWEDGLRATLDWAAK